MRNVGMTIVLSDMNLMVISLTLQRNLMKSGQIFINNSINK